MAQILVVDDEVGIRELLSEILADEGHQVSLADSAAEARRQRDVIRLIASESSSAIESVFNLGHSCCLSEVGMLFVATT